MAVARLRRIASKPPGYIARRLADEARRELQRAVVRRAAAGRGRYALARILPADTASVLAATAERAQALVPVASAAAGTQRIARARAREMELFGDAPVAAGIPPRWLEDVRSGFGWPVQDHRRLDYRNVGRPSDVKVAWELSRLRHLVALAQSGEPADLEVLADDLADWVRTNPMGWSVNWACAMEVALRAVNLICVDGILLAAGASLDRDTLVRTLYQHGWFLARNLEISDVNGNHYVADAVGLVWLGCYFGGLGEADRWYRTGLEMLRSASREQVFDDGLDHEGSLPYHVLVLEMLVTARVAAGDDLADIDPALRRMARALVTVMGPDGRVPDLGDDDGGRVLAIDEVASNDARRVLAMAEGVIGPVDAMPKPAHLPDGGVVVLGGGDDHVVVSVGPVGFRGRGGHGHVDACSFEATLGGEPAVRDSGTGSYTGDPGLRNELRDAPAHSLWILDGMRYATVGDVDRLWSVDGDSPPELLALEGDERAQTLTLRQRLPCRAGTATFERKLSWTPGALVVEDSLEAPPGTVFSAHLQPDGPLRGGGHVFEPLLPPGAELSVEACRRSRRYLSVEPAERAVVRGTVQGDAPVRLTWRIRNA